jgi:hypothetical protein
MAFRLKSKGRPRGKPFEKGNRLAAVSGGGKPFVKLAQRLSVVAADALSEQASNADCALVGLPLGSSKARVVVESCYRAALLGETGAARALFEFTESARIRVEAHVLVDLSIYESALAFLDSIPDLPALPEGKRPS